MAKHVHIHVIDAGWEEDKHKRGDDGKFSSSGGGGGSKPQGMSSEARASLEKKHPEMKAMRKHSEGLSKATGVEHQISRGSNGKFYVTRVSGSVSHPDMSGKPHELKEWKKLSKVGGHDTPEAAFKAASAYYRAKKARSAAGKAAVSTAKAKVGEALRSGGEKVVSKLKEALGDAENKQKMR